MLGGSLEGLARTCIALSTGLASLGGLLLVAVREVESGHVPGGAGVLAALAAALCAAGMLAGAPPGWVAAHLADRTALPAALAWAGAFAPPALAAGGLLPGAAPSAAAWGLSLAGAWAGLALGALGSGFLQSGKRRRIGKHAGGMVSLEGSRSREERKG